MHLRGHGKLTRLQCHIILPLSTLIFLRFYVTAYIQFDAFAKIDGCGDGGQKDEDRKMDLKEWKAGYKNLKGYGFVCFEGLKKDKDADAAFKRMDDNGGGIVLLIEFCDFVKAAEIEAGSELGALLAADEAAPASDAGKGGSGASNGGVPGEIGPSQELKDFKECFRPYCAESDAAKALRKKGFRAADPNGNGLCSLAELEGFVLGTLVTKFPKDPKKKDHRGDPLEYGKDLFDAFRPSYIRAFNDAKDYKADTGKVLAGMKKATNDDFVSFGEFKYFCEYVCIYGGMFDAFAKIDGGGAGRDANDDRKMDLKEWLAGYPKCKGYGFVGLDSIKDDKEATAIFKKKMDDNGGGIVLLDEFSEYLKDEEVKAGTAMGELLSADEVAVPQVEEVVVEEDPTGGNGPTVVYQKFCDVFQPYVGDTEDAMALRKRSFRAADPNGNGLCSLAELESFVLAELIKKYPKDPETEVELGRDIWTAFRPAYIRAFNDAKDFLRDDGQTMAGTKKATSKDFVSRGEFKYFCAYIIAYGAIFDAFSKIDGFGEGRDANDDRKMDLKEWMAGYKNITGYGWVAFSDIKDDEHAKRIFHEMDDGGGVILLIEMSEYIKNHEIAAGTDLGALLKAEESEENFALRMAKKKAKAPPAPDPLADDLPIEDRGRFLWDLYRPSYIRAFNDAKDYKQDTGKVIEGTKKSTADDFVSKGEFRVFCSYVCIYAAMFDAFSKIDGGGAGRDKNDDRRMDLAEWLAGWRGIQEYGFVAFSSINNDDDANEVFSKMDDNGGNVVLMDEFCNYIKEEEIKADTPLGRLLNAEEENGPDSKADTYAVDFSKAGSLPLILFSETFLPLTGTSDEAVRMRKVGFGVADPNGNGLCSLAELEVFVLKQLLYKFKKDVAKKPPDTSKGNSFPKTGPPKIANKAAMSKERQQEQAQKLKAAKETEAAFLAEREKARLEHLATQKAKQRESRAKLLAKCEELKTKQDEKLAADRESKKAAAKRLSEASSLSNVQSSPSGATRGRKTNEKGVLSRKNSTSSMASGVGRSSSLSSNPPQARPSSTPRGSSNGRGVRTTSRVTSSANASAERKRPPSASRSSSMGPTGRPASASRNRPMPSQRRST